MYNSTISRKKKTCTSCGKLTYLFSRKRCQPCATYEDTMARLSEQTENEIEKEGTADIIKVADALFSKFIRLSHADENGITKCYTCDKESRWQEAQNGHYISRGNLFLRFDPRNCRVQCVECNELKHGNLAEYTRRLEAEHPGITDILKTEATVIYKPAESEIYAIINEYKRRIKTLKKPI
jgi:hypothetical protein